MFSKFMMLFDKLKTVHMCIYIYIYDFIPLVAHVYHILYYIQLHFPCNSNDKTVYSYHHIVLAFNIRIMKRVLMQCHPFTKLICIHMCTRLGIKSHSLLLTHMHACNYFWVWMKQLYVHIDQSITKIWPQVIEISALCDQGLLLLTWINLNPSMYK